MMTVTKKKYLWGLVLLTLLVDVAGGWIFFRFFLEHYFSGYPLIPVFFGIVGLLNVQLFDYLRHRNPKQLHLVYMGGKAVRMVLSILMILVYCLVVRQEARAFALTFAANYLIFLTYETCFFFGYEQNKKLQNKRK